MIEAPDGWLNDSIISAAHMLLKQLIHEWQGSERLTEYPAWEEASFFSSSSIPESHSNFAR